MKIRIDTLWVNKPELKTKSNGEGAYWRFYTGNKKDGYFTCMVFKQCELRDKMVLGNVEAVLQKYKGKMVSLVIKSWDEPNKPKPKDEEVDIDLALQMIGDDEKGGAK